MGARRILKEAKRQINPENADFLSRNKKPSNLYLHRKVLLCLIVKINVTTYDTSLRAYRRENQALPGFSGKAIGEITAHNRKKQLRAAFSEKRRVLE
ncbi:hypothetical protein [Photobacterium atrarenae]|uniref:Uncharacterized protein n=1 Tax=Photobacterium atrarenae TaxID=865757 RepID=A0ABY5GJ16_9GAMM|nr:hypothetical protein [Photobacterium atrarenae]UTV28704.1 hypothetical protein NNL38_05505 [Photobacterium atrarenae]